MSLLLDALKKAADDKKKLSQSKSVEPASANRTVPEPDVSAETMADDVVETADELTLDPLETEIIAPEAVAADTEVRPPAFDPPVGSGENKSVKDESTTSYTVSDEALSMLIYKTNRDVRQSKRWVIISVLLASLVILISGGVYYYLDAQAEIVSLERKHQIAMHSMELKTRKEKIPEKSRIIRNLVGETGLDDKVQYAKKHLAAEKRSKQSRPRSAVTSKNGGKVGAVAAAISFQKNKKTDPVAEKLEQAWLAYEAASYKQAKRLYKEVIGIEKNNRDALLGLGAIAVIEKNNNAARSIYFTLLKSDPRDPLAISALAGLRHNVDATESDEKYLLTTLQKNPDDAHLNFALGNVYAQQAKWKLAQQAYFNAWQSDTENANYLFNLGVSMDQLGKHKQAIEFYQNCLNASRNKQVAFSREAVQKRIAELSGL